MARTQVCKDDRKQQREQSPPAAGSQTAALPVEQRDNGHKAGRGRPRRYGTVEAMELAIDRYFLTAEKPTVSELALELGFTSRQGLYNYKAYGPEFSYAVKRARLRVEAYYEEKLLDKDACASDVIRALKRLGWRG